ncbi:MAG TPA: RNA methyltransferase [Myxococcota bacterium]|nr:RNA methyltransferase [Myxococcota bacterium]
MKLVATCGAGLEGLLAVELRSLGHDVDEQVGAVTFEGTAEQAVDAVLRLRTANRVLIDLGGWAASNQEDLYRGAFKLIRARKDSLFAPSQTLAIRASTSASMMMDVRYVALKVKDAVVDAQRERWGTRSNIDREAPQLPLRLRLHRNRATLLLDACGVPLDHRGYRKTSTAAPLRETLAAGAILASGWTGEGPVVDPMCGSGTLLVEAAWIAQGRSPQTLRGDFPWLDFPDFPRRPQLGALLRPPPLFGGDINVRALEATRENLRAAGLQVKLRRGDAMRCKRPGPRGLLTLNPPYGHRLEGIDWHALDTWLRTWSGWHVVLVAAETPGLELEPERVLNVRNGPLSVRILCFSIP